MMSSILLLLGIGIITPLVSQNIRSLELSQIMSMKYQCTNAGCSPLMIISASTLKDCGLACLMYHQCRTATFYESMNQCELFTNSYGEYGTFTAEVNAISVTAIDDRQLSPRSIINWVVNGDAEQGSCLFTYGPSTLQVWNYSGFMTQMCYNFSSVYIRPTDPGPSDRGKSYFSAQQNSFSLMWQIVNITETINSAFIDNHAVWFNLSAWLGGYRSQNDNARILLTFIDQTTQTVGNSTMLGPVLANDRGNKTSLVFRQTIGLVPSGARAFNITVIMTGGNGADNDGAADNIAVNFYQ